MILRASIALTFIVLAIALFATRDRSPVFGLHSPGVLTNVERQISQPIPFRVDTASAA